MVRGFTPIMTDWRRALRKIFEKYGALLGLAGTIIALDQLTKWLVRSNLSFSEMWTPEPWMAPYFQIVFWKNTGAAFGMFQDMSIVFTILAFVISIAILYYYPRVPAADRPLRLALALQLSGAVGNLIDRLTLGYVTDFIALLPAWGMPVFNIADASITGGVILLIITMWQREREQQAESENASPKSEAERLPGKLPEESCGE
jgi:signal peptidase II